MNTEQAKSQLARFMGSHQHLTFTFETLENEEWIARCNEIPGIITGGASCTQLETKEAIKDAILTAAGIDGVHADELLRDASITQTLMVSR